MKRTNRSYQVNTINAMGMDAHLFSECLFSGKTYPNQGKICDSGGNLKPKE